MEAAVEIDNEKLKDFVINMFKNYRDLETELMAYRMMIRLVTITGMASGIPWEETLEAGKKNPMLIKMMADKYDPIVADVLKAIDQAGPGQALSEWMKKWKPSGPVN